MKPGRVIGNVTLSKAAPQFRGGRWLVVVPMGPDELEGGGENSYGGLPSPVVYDSLGAGTGDVILYVEGAEATTPFDGPMPIDALNIALVDRYEFRPPAGHRKPKPGNRVSGRPGLNP